MSQDLDKPSAGVGAQVGTALLVVVVFTLIGFVALSVVTGNTFGLNGGAGTQPDAAAAPTPPPGTPNPAAWISYKHTALGFSLQYPRQWRKAETGLQVVLSPSAGGLNPAALQDSALWLGIPANGSADPAAVLAGVQASLPAGTQTLSQGSRRIGGQSWQLNLVQFDSQTLGPMKAAIAATSKNEVGYFVVAAAPENRWPQIEPTFNTILNSFQFTAEAVLRPTDATPPPTPTPTPTPVFYIVQPGDTLSHVSVKYDVSIEALRDRNGLTENSILHPGDKLLIPRKRRR